MSTEKKSEWEREREREGERESEREKEREREREHKYTIFTCKHGALACLQKKAYFQPQM